MAGDAGSPRSGPIRHRALVLYAGERTPHRSCGIALAEAFGRCTEPYQALRRGGITGRGPCGATVAGRLLLGEFLGDPDPTGPTTPALRRAVETYEARLAERIDRRGVAGWVCNDLTAPHGPFHGARRHRFCTRLVADVAGIVAEILEAHGVEVQARPVRLSDGSVYDPVRDGPPPEAETLEAEDPEPEDPEPEDPEPEDVVR